MPEEMLKNTGLIQFAMFFKVIYLVAMVIEINQMFRFLIILSFQKNQ